MIQLNNVLLVTGSGRNVGKTSLICHLIANCLESAICIKISNHFHKKTPSLAPVVDNNQLFIGIETDSFSSKDTSRYLKAGATQSIYIQAKDDQLPSVVDFINNDISSDIPIIIESSALGQLIEPGAACFVVSSSIEKLPNWEFEHKIIKGFCKEKCPLWPEYKWNKNNEWQYINYHEVEMQ